MNEPHTVVLAGTADGPTVTFQKTGGQLCTITFSKEGKTTTVTLSCTDPSMKQKLTNALALDVTKKKGKAAFFNTVEQLPFVVTAINDTSVVYPPNGTSHKNTLAIIEFLSQGKNQPIEIGIDIEVKKPKEFDLSVLAANGHIYGTNILADFDTCFKLIQALHSFHTE